MKKKIIISLLVILLIGGQGAFGETGKDIIVLFDVSESVLPIFNDLQSYLIDTVLRGHVRFGDTIHLISFASQPDMEISRTIMSEDDIEPVIARILLIQPLGRYTDLISAFNYLYQYVFDLPANSEKMVIILSDGIHDPPPTSPFYGVADPDSQIKAIARSIHDQGWGVFLIGLPSDNGTIASGSAAGTGVTSGGTEGTEGTDSTLLNGISEALGVNVNTYPDDLERIRALGYPTVRFPDYLGKVGTRFSMPFTFTNPADQRVMLRVGQILFEKKNILDSPQTILIDSGSPETAQLPVTLPEEMERGEKTIEIQLGFVGEVTAYPFKGTVSFEYSPRRASGFKGAFNYILIGIGGLVVLVGIVFLVLFFRRLLEGTAVKGVKTSAQRQAERPAGAAGTTGLADGTRVAGGTAARKAVSGGNVTGGARVSPYATATAASRTSGMAATDSRTASHVPAADVQRAHPALPPAQAAQQSKTRLEQLSKHKAAGVPVETVNLREKESVNIEMSVAGQNPFSGHRNIETFRAGMKKEIGGKSSPYSIFIIHIQERIGEISFDGEKFSLSVLKPEYFPGSPERIEDCLNRDITVYDASGRHSSLYFRIWESPVERINRIMHLTDAPGLPDWFLKG